MSKWITISWHGDELRLLTIFTRGDKLEVRAGKKFPLSSAGIASPELRAQCAEWITSQHLAKTDTLFVLPRSVAEIRLLSIPVVPKDEIPTLIRFQAAREFTAFDATSPLDFCILPQQTSSAQTSSAQRIFVAVIRATLLRQVEQLVEEAHLKLRRVVLQPCELVHLWNAATTSSSTNSADTVLLLEVDGDEVRQTCVAHGMPIFVRAQQLAHSAEDNSTWTTQITSEVKRTIVAVHNESFPPINQVVLLGDLVQHPSLAATLQESLSVPTHIFAMENLISFAAAKTEMAENFSASLLSQVAGSILAAAHNQPAFVDFLHPKRPAQASGKRSMLTGIVAILLTLITGLIIWGFLQKNSLETQMTQLKNQITAINRKKPELTQVQQQLTQIEAWHANDIAWFEELDWLSRGLPDAKDVVFTSMTMRANKGEATFSIPALAKNADVVSSLEDLLTDAQHQISMENLTENQNNARYPLRFQMTLQTTHSATKTPKTEMPKTEMPTANSPVVSTSSEEN